MIPTHSFRGRRVAVFGLGGSGMATALSLIEGGAEVLAARLARQLGLQDGYRLVINCKERAGQTVPHLHLHQLGGRAFTWPPG